MSRPGITYFDVAKAAQQIIGQGKAPTIELVRILLGTGSNSTIGSHLRTWRAQQDPTQQLATQAHLPEEFIALMKGLWERLIHQAEAQVETIRQETHHEITQLKQTVQHLQQENVRGQQQQQEKKQELNGLTQEKSTLEQMMMTHQKEAVALQTKQEGFTQQLQEKQTHIEELHRQNQQTQANLEHYRTASLEQRQQEQQRSEQQQNQLEQTIQQLKNEVAQLREQKMELKQSNEQLHFEKTSLQAQLDKITAHDETTSAKLMETHQSLVQQTNTQQHWQVQYEDLEVKWEEQTKLNVELKMQQAVLSQKIAITTTELEEITAQNKVLAHDKWFLGQEKAQLFGQLKQLGTMV